MKIKKEVVLRKVAGESILVPLGETVEQYNGVFVLTPTAELLWRAIENGADEKGLVLALLSEYDVKAEKAAADVSEFLEKLSAFGII